MTFICSKCKKSFPEDRTDYTMIGLGQVCRSCFKNNNNWAHLMCESDEEKEERLKRQYREEKENMFESAIEMVYEEAIVVKEQAEKLGFEEKPLKAEHLENLSNDYSYDMRFKKKERGI